MYEKLNPDDFGQLVDLLGKYKESIGEGEIDSGRKESLFCAVERGDIDFFTAKDGGRLVAMCSVSLSFSTYLCGYSGTFEDFYVAPEYRHRGIARKIVELAVSHLRENGVRSLLVGCADCDVGMYKSLGFETELGHLLAMEINI